MTALAAEAVWTRMLSLLLGATTYTFSLILAAFLVGLGIGSSVGSMHRAHAARSAASRSACASAADAAIAWAGVLDDEAAPVLADQSRPCRPARRARSRSTSCAVCGRCCRRRCLWGASFPLALAAAGRGEKDPGRLVGTVYAANTVGGIIGALFGSLLVIAWLGTQDAQRILIGIAAISAIVAFLSGRRRRD